MDQKDFWNRETSVGSIDRHGAIFLKLNLNHSEFSQTTQNTLPLLYTKNITYEKYGDTPKSSQASPAVSGIIIIIVSATGAGGR